MRARVVIVDAVDIAEQDQQVSVDQVGDQCRQGVVLAECPAAQFFVGDDVVLVDDRYDAVLEQAQQRIADVEVAAALGHVAAGDQRLGGSQTVALKQRVVALDELGLPDRCQGLTGSDRGAGFADTDARPPGGHGARGDDGDLGAPVAKFGHLAHDFIEHARIEAVRARGEQVGAQLADDAARLGTSHRERGNPPFSRSATASPQRGEAEFL